MTEADNRPSCPELRLHKRRLLQGDLLPILGSPCVRKLANAASSHRQEVDQNARLLPRYGFW